MPNQNLYSSWATPLGMNWLVGTGGVILALLVLWSIAWKGLALWRAARKESKVWFIVLLVVNTVGILDILYLYVFSKMGTQAGEEKKEEGK